MMRSLRCIRTVLLLLLLLPPLSVHLNAQSYVMVDSVRLPAESFVGDQIELRYTLRTTADLRAPATPPSPSWGEIGSVRVIPRADEFDVRVVVVPFEPGTLTLPRIDLGGVQLEGLSISVASVLEGSGELRAIYGPQRLPGTQLAILLVALLVVVPAGAALYLLGPGRVLIQRVVAAHRARVPYRNLMRTMERLEAGIKKDSSREFYTALVYGLQDLMTNRLGFECRAATSSELRAYLPALATRCGRPADEAEPLAQIFAAADEVKFAHGQIRRTVRVRHLELCREIMTELETSRRRLRRARTSASRSMSSVDA